LSYTRAVASLATSSATNGGSRSWGCDTPPMEVRFRLVDAFTETPFQGNRLCVVPETPDEFSTEQMKMLALETNFSETTFVTESRPDGYRMRIFTPDAELPFAGHPTIGTAYTSRAKAGRRATPCRPLPWATCPWRSTWSEGSRG
jgi:hypothetical protein